MALEWILGPLVGGGAWDGIQKDELLLWQSEILPMWLLLVLLRKTDIVPSIGEQEK